MLGDELINAAGSISGSVEYIKLDVSDLMRHFAGNWATHSTYSSSYICFCPDGTYSDKYEASVSGEYTDDGGNYEGSWNVMDGDQNQGRWTVRGTKDQGTIIVQLSNGEVLEYEYSVHIEDGYKYYSEYYFNGNLYSKPNE